MELAAEPAQPGFHEDPLNPQRLRWHDGEQWTSRTRCPAGTGSAKAKRPSWLASFAGALCASAVYPLAAGVVGQPIDWTLAASLSLIYLLLASIRLVVVDSLTSMYGRGLLASGVTAFVMFLVGSVVVGAAVLSGVDPTAARRVLATVPGVGPGHAAPTTPAPSAEPTVAAWTPELIDNASFSVDTPVPLQHRPVVDRNGLALHRTWFRWQGDRYVVMWVRVDGTLRATPLRNHLAKIFDADAAVVRRRPFTWRGLPAFDATVKGGVTPGLNRARTVVAKHHLIIVVAGSPDLDRAPKYADRFLNSLRAY